MADISDQFLDAVLKVMTIKEVAEMSSTEVPLLTCEVFVNGLGDVGSRVSINKEAIEDLCGDAGMEWAIQNGNRVHESFREPSQFLANIISEKWGFEYKPE